MNNLDLQRLFTDCPYTVKKVGNEYTFKTDNDIVYAVDFKEDFSFDPIPAFWFDLSNRSGKASPLLIVSMRKFQCFMIASHSNGYGTDLFFISNFGSWNNCFCLYGISLFSH